MPYHMEMRSREGPVDARFHGGDNPGMSLEDLAPRVEEPRPQSHRHHIVAAPVGDPQAGPKRSLVGRAEHLSRLHAKCANCPVISYESTGALY